ncbi:MAG: hypothetical protein IKE52_01145 [Mogibacterium sp.]|nr:hypothetical protein [Mogibacterium sp.]
MIFVMGLMLPMIYNYRQFNYVATSAAELMKGGSFMMNFSLVLLAVLASVEAFDYMHRQVSSNTMHSLPLNRTRLFNSAFISGWLMIVVPIVVFAVMLMSLRGATSINAGPAATDFYDMFGTEAMSAKEIFTLPHMFEFIITSVVVATVVYAIACLAGVLSGQKGIHGLLAYFLFFAPVGLVLLLDTTCGRFLVGYDGLNFDYTYLNVCAYAMAKEGFGLEAGMLLYYIAIAVILTVASLLIYKRVKLERVGNSTTFPAVGDTLATILAAVLTITFTHTSTLFAFDSSMNDATRFALTSIIASTVMYAAMRMIADSSYKIFNKRNFIQYGIFLAVLAVIMAFTVFDITGYERRVPNADEIKSVSCRTVFQQAIPQIDNNEDRRSDNPALIKDVLNLHEAIVNDESILNELNNIWSEDYDMTSSCDVTIVWELENGREMKRKYDVKCNGSDSEKALRRLYDNKAFKERFREDLNTIFANARTIKLSDMGSEELIEIRKDDWKDIQAALTQDIMSRTFDQTVQIGDEAGNYIDIETAERAIIGNKFYTLWICEEYDKNIYKVLKEKGYKK